MIILISETTAFFCFLVYASFFEWTLHKYLMHTPLWQYPFRAHALVHHGLFRTGAHYFLPDAKVIRKVRFAVGAPFIIILLHRGCLDQEHWKQEMSSARGAHPLFLYEYLTTACIFPNAGWKRHLDADWTPTYASQTT
jgi:hypothetical protein